MSEILIAGKQAYSFGENNYSGGMTLVTFDPRKVSLDEVKKLPKVHLNPFCEPNELEIFALVGTTTQFLDWYKQGIDSFCTQAAVKKYGGMPHLQDVAAWEELDQMKNKLVEDFEPWYKGV